MKSFLDDQKNFNQFDTLSVYDSIQLLGQQFESTWHETQFLSLNFEPNNIENIIFVGMGGSSLPAHLILSLSPLLLKVPFEIVSNYRLPQYVTKKTLVILVSYSGNTEEVLSCAQDALKHQSKILVITSGGKLKDFAIQEHLPIVLIDDNLNKSHIPRYGIGLLIGAIFGIMTRMNPESYKFVDPKKIVHVIERSLESLNKEQPTNNNSAKIFSIKNKGQAILIITANHLNGIGKISGNFINETSKTFSAYFTIPDINHHLMEGLAFPVNLKDNFRFILLNSSLYPEIIQKRFQITENVLIKQNYQLTVIKPESSEIISQVFESLVFFIMISYYLSIVNKQNPGSNPWVDFFKKQLI